MRGLHSVLQAGGRGRDSLGAGEELGLVHHQLLLEVQPHRLLILQQMRVRLISAVWRAHLSPVPEGADQLDGESLVVDEILNLQHAVHRVRARGRRRRVRGLCVVAHSPGDVVHEVSPTQIDGHGTIGGAFLEHSECDGHSEAEAEPLTPLTL